MKASVIIEAFDRTSFNGAQRLRALDQLFGYRVEEAHAATEERRAFIRKIRELAKSEAYGTRYDHPVVCVVEGGRDCDGVVYSGRRSTVKATVAAVEEHIARVLAWADGPVYFDVVAVDDESFTYQQRDATLEAFEDGHPHCIHA